MGDTHLGSTVEDLIQQQLAAEAVEPATVRNDGILNSQSPCGVVRIDDDDDVDNAGRASENRVSNRNESAFLDLPNLTASQFSSVLWGLYTLLYAPLTSDIIHTTRQLYYRQDLFGNGKTTTQTTTYRKHIHFITIFQEIVKLHTMLLNVVREQKLHIDPGTLHVPREELGLHTSNSQHNNWHCIDLLQALFHDKYAHLNDLLVRHGSYLQEQECLIIYPLVFSWIHGTCNLRDGNLDSFAKQKTFLQRIEYQPPLESSFDMFFRRCWAEYERVYTPPEEVRVLDALECLLKSTAGPRICLQSKDLYALCTNKCWDVDNEFFAVIPKDTIETELHSQLHMVNKKALLFLEMNSRNLSKTANAYVQIL